MKNFELSKTYYKRVKLYTMLKHLSYHFNFVLLYNYGRIIILSEKIKLN